MLFYQKKGGTPVKFKKWIIGSPREQDVDLLRSAGYSYLLSTVLAARGVSSVEDAAELLPHSSHSAECKELRRLSPLSAPFP